MLRNVTDLGPLPRAPRRASAAAEGIDQRERGKRQNQQDSKEIEGAGLEPPGGPHLEGVEDAVGDDVKDDGDDNEDEGFQVLAPNGPLGCYLYQLLSRSRDRNGKRPHWGLFLCVDGCGGPQ